MPKFTRRKLHGQFFISSVRQETVNETVNETKNENLTATLPKLIKNIQIFKNPSVRSTICELDSQFHVNLTRVTDGTEKLIV